MSTLRNERVTVIGAGGLGCPALYALGPTLAARGATVVIVDDDRVDLSNLQRQILHRTSDLGRLKVDSAKDALLRRFPALAVETVALRVTAKNAREVVAGSDVVLDGTDSVEAKFLINDACVAERVALVHGGVLRFSGQLLSVLPGAACYRCLFEEPPPPEAAPSCQEAGVLGAVCGLIGAKMAEEALAILDGRPRLASTLLVIDALAPVSTQERRIRIRPRPGCAACDAPVESAFREESRC